LYYAKQGIITPEMEYIAIRENQRIGAVGFRFKRNGFPASETVLVPKRRKIKSRLNL
jgi:thiamine biosynthesis protein ThiC